jgi:predicted RND superfamily exporter protein
MIMIEQLARAMVRWRYLVVLLTFVLAFLAASGGKNLGFDTNYRIFFAEGNPQLEAFDNLQETYTKTDNILFMLIPEDGDVFDKDTMSLAHELTEAGWQLPFTSRVDSLSNYQHTTADEEELVVEDLILETEDLTPERLAYIKSVSINEPLLRQRLISPEGHVTAVNVTVRLPQEDATETQILVQEARKLRDEFKAKYPNIDIKLTGMVMMSNAFAEASMVDMSTLMPIMFLVVLITLAVLLRSFSGTFNTLLVIILSIMSAMGLAGWFGAVISPPVASAPTIILTMAVADAVHLLVTMQQNMRRGMDKHEAIIDSVRINFMPVLITSVTTAIGFLTMNFSEAPPFHTLGNVVAMGVFIAFVLSVTFLPALAAILPMKVAAKPEGESHSTAMDKLADFVIAKRRLLFVGTIILTIGLVAMIPRNEVNDNFVEYFDKSVDFRVASDYGNENLISVYNIEYSLAVKEKGGISEPQFLADSDRFANWLRSQPEVQHVNTITDTFKRLNKSMHADDPSWYKLPDERELAAQYLLLYELSLPFGLDLNDQINTDKNSTRIVATFENQSSQGMLELEIRIKAWLDKEVPYMEVYGASPGLMFAHIGTRNVNSMVGGTMLALVLISFILVVALRSFKFGLLSLAPNLIPAGLAFGLWAVFNGEIGMSLATAAGMTLGIVVDDTVHFLSKYLRARREKGYTPEQAVRYAFHTVAVALWVTTIVLCCGFGVLIFSTFKMNADMGLMTAMTLAIALIVDFLFLPALLLKVDGDSKSETETSN